ncbi:MAG: large repetitive protein, partial [Frankiales bacterium]|nr:large repetitive protein [Frankiales bacterium]
MSRRHNFIHEIAQEVPVSTARHLIRGVVVALAAGALIAPAAQAAPVLYGATGVTAADTTPASNLYTINPDTGATTSIGSIGKAITGLAVDGTDGTLYGVTAGVQLDGSERQLLKINPATGASTVVGSLGANEIEDIAVSALGQLYGWNETGDDLYRISKATGALEKVGESGLGVTFGDGLAFVRNGALYGMLDGDFGHIFKIDPASGAAAPIAG